MILKVLEKVNLFYSFFEIFKMRHRNFYLSILYIFAFILLILFFNYKFDGSKTDDFENYQKILVRFLYTFYLFIFF